MMERLSDAWVIHLFALLHVLVAFGTRLLGLSDTLVLTLLTMMLAVVLCQRRRVDAVTMTLVLIFVNVAGFFLVKPLGHLLNVHVFRIHLFVGPVTTMAVTEFLGWCVLGISNLAVRHGRKTFGTSDAYRLRWLQFAFIVIIAVRFLMVFLCSDYSSGENIHLNVALDYLFCSGAVLYLAQYSLKISFKEEKSRKLVNMVQYNYQKLKQQVEPHFMFNCLNVLNGIVYENDMRSASTFIRKLAGMYRYLIDSENEMVVTLREEMAFVHEYVDLLKVRFEDAISVEYDIDEACMSCLVAPCAVQLLIENAMKHNAITEDAPLVVRVSVEDGYIVVTNSLCPKLSKEPSTGLGLKYIEQQYNDICSRKVIVLSDELEFTVKLPLIDRSYGSIDSRG